MARAMGGASAERTEQNHRKDNECSARQAGGRSSRQVLGRPTVQWALDERGFNIIGEKIVQFPTETRDTLNRSSARWAYLFRASFSWQEQNNRERKTRGRPAQGSRASFI
ncbi:hypothetical protein ISN45_Un16g000040 (mitochondrion) [Arabidopsis thaliana x Arabidopsis arenosa]|uniref:Uncharacterized protein n=2 Tax=Arabidopsis TaxID=3701 RepID=A0A8T1XDW9_9BRAS|nr:hypothetical protein ISN44_Un156g000050 [Arabidopsis suecica]KAG7530630.1 hypothetical protein ISN45_Un26g000070 [Arabidopsis thaliana x Arabidopsis arenosa]KAG7530828.1 hypothetical protein ISN45_Un16g000040 [Arabidopsis thaliana x Arabidopsis arenosa]